tara:strand:+ start:594 stop:1805 length:1212 start_codon:yes stop_codon:yes gene_type:complete
MFQFIRKFFVDNIVYETKIAFIGLGKLGMPCAEAIQKKGFDVTGYDTQSKTSRYVDIKNSIADTVIDRDIIFIATPTPHEHGYDGSTPVSDKEPKDFDYSEVKKVLRDLNEYINPSQTVVLISTVLPGTIRRELSTLLSNNNIIYNPYLIAMGTVEDDFYNPEMIMIGSEQDEYTNAKVEQLENFYNQVCKKSPRIVKSTWEETECIKIFYNTFISTKISFVNMIQDVANKMSHINADVVAEALANSTQRIISSRYMKPGMGDGGSCHPRDNIALRWLAKDLNLGYDIFGNVMLSREKQAENMAREILKHGKNIYFSSDTYKPGTDLLNGSYSVLVQHFVMEQGGNVVSGLAGEKADVIVRVHQDDKIESDGTTIIFDPWRSYPSADNVVHYGKDSKIFMSGK